MHVYVCVQTRVCTVGSYRLPLKIIPVHTSILIHYFIYIHVGVYDTNKMCLQMGKN